MTSNQYMDTEIEEIFPTKTLSVWQFIIENGQGCYIPPYQRPYSWDEENILRLFEDVLRGIRQITERPDTMSFIGAIIAFHDTGYQTVNPIYHNEVPSRVMTIIDGQQRICTILMSNIVLHDYIRRIGKQFKTERERHLSWIYNECVQILDDLKDTYTIDQRSGEGNFRYYPRVIRAYSDAWSRRRSRAKYESPVAKLIWKYIKFTNTEMTSQFQLNLGNGDAYKMADNAFRAIQEEVERICHSQSSESDFPNLVDFSQVQDSLKGIWHCAPPAEVQQYIDNASNEQYYAYFCRLLRCLILARYLNNRVATTVVTTRNEDDAIDMFEALNTTGQSLTAFETFKPKVVEREQLQKYEETESHRWVTEIEEYLNRYRKADERQRNTADMLVHFALFETGFELQMTLNHQRRYLRDEFEKLTQLNDIEKNRAFVQSLARLASFMARMWDIQKGTKPDFASLDINDEEAMVGFQVLKELNHSITIAPLCRFFQQILDAEQKPYRVDRTEDFVAAIKATVAFSILWRGAMGETRNIDARYRDIMRAGISLGTELIPPLARRSNGQSESVSLSNYKKALQLVLRDRGNIRTKEDWVSRASTTPIYKHSKKIARFLVFCASDGTIPDETQKGLLRKGRPPINPLLTLGHWNDTTYLTIEHIAPKSIAMGWNEDIYNDSKTVHTLGNLILLPKDVNEIIDNKIWKHKQLLYNLLSAETIEEFRKREMELKSAGLNFGKKTEEVLANAKYLGLCKSVALYDDNWSLDIIQRRSRCFAELAWDRLENWLFQ